MRARPQAVTRKLASLPVVRWRLWHDERWQKTSLWSACVWSINFGVLYVGVTNWGHGWWIIIGQTLFWDAVTYFVNKKKFWGDRKVSYASSGSFAFAAWLFFFLSHKAMLVLLAFLGIGALTAQIALAGIGVLENPVRYVYNNRYAFAATAQDPKA